jgi:hypothetical protein
VSTPPVVLPSRPSGRLRLDRLEAELRAARAAPFRDAAAVLARRIAGLPDDDPARRRLVALHQAATDRAARIEDGAP